MSRVNKQADIIVLIVDDIPIDIGLLARIMMKSALGYVTLV